MAERTLAEQEQLKRISEARHHAPYEVLGPHPNVEDKNTTVRVLPSWKVCDR